MSAWDENIRLDLLGEGRQLLARMKSERPDLHIDEISDWSNRVLDWAAFAGERVPLPGATFHVDFGWEENAQAYVEELVAILSGSSTTSETAVVPGRAFISYVREDVTSVSRLAEELVSYGARVWLDRDDLAHQLGLDWRDLIHRAITAGSFFIWCYSAAFARKSSSYAHEELDLAIEELGRRSRDQAWFVPVKLTAVDIPDREIGGGRHLGDIQWVDLAANWYKGVRQIAQLIAPLPPKVRTRADLLESPKIRERVDAAEHIYESPDPRLVVPLCEFIRRAGLADFEAVHLAGQALKEIGDTRAVPVLIEAILHGVGKEYKLVEDLEVLQTEESVRFLEDYRSAAAGGSSNKWRWLHDEAQRRGVRRGTIWT
jgi:hypothetical protein